MHCPRCGTASVQGMRYCKGCGDDLFAANTPVEPPVQVVRTTGAALAVALATIAITLGGLAISFGFASELLRPYYGGPNGYIQQPNSRIPVALLMVAFGSATVLGVIIMLIKLFTKLMRLPEDAPRKVKQEIPAPPIY